MRIATKNTGPLPSIPRPDPPSNPIIHDRIDSCIITPNRFIHSFHRHSARSPLLSSSTIISNITTLDLLWLQSCPNQRSTQWHSPVLVSHSPWPLQLFAHSSKMGRGQPKEKKQDKAGGRRASLESIALSLRNSEAG